MPNTIDRKSIIEDLSSRYNNQKIGGAFDARKSGTSTIDISQQSNLFEDNNKFLIKLSPGATSNFKGINIDNNYKEISVYSNNIDTRKYK